MASNSSPAAQTLLRRHPLQRFESPSRGPSALLHLTGLISFASSFKYLADHPNTITASYGWHFQYLTIVGLSLASTTFLLGLLADLTLSHRVFLLKNALSVTSAPLETLISLLYWGLRSIDTKLVLPDWAPRLPLLDDLGFHALPSLFLALDLLFFSPPYTISALPAMLLSLVIALGYWVWIDVCYAHNGFYPYPIFEVLSPPWRAVLFGGSAVTMTLSTLTLRWLYGVVNGRGVGGERVGRVKGG